MFSLGALQLGMVVAIAVACLALWNNILVQWTAGREIVPYEPRRAVPWGPREVAIVALLGIGLQILCALPFVEHRYSSARNEEETGIAASDEVATDEVARDDKVAEETEHAKEIPFGLVIAASVGSLLALAVACVWLGRLGADWQDLGFDNAHLGKDFQRGVAGFLVASVPVFVIQLSLSFFIPPQHAVSDIFHAHPGFAVLAATALSAVVVAPLAEEFFFRVLLQGWLESLYKQRGAALAGGNESLPSPTLYVGEDFDRHQSLLAADHDTEPSTVPFADAQEPTEGIPALPELANQSFPPSAAPASIMPVILSSAVFALVHLGNGPSPIPLFFFALVLGYLYRQTHRLAPSLVAHASLNLLSTFMLAIGAG